jgi:hypothetical protein
MLNKIKFSIFVAILTLVSLASISLAIDCPSCYLEKCSCSVEECSSGRVNIYLSECLGAPDYSYTFSDGTFSWQPPSAKTYWLMALCDDGETSTCQDVRARSTKTTTTTSTPITTSTTPKTTTTTTTAPGGGVSMTLLWIFLVVILVAAAGVYFFIIKKKPKGKYEELYSKWRR